MALVCLAGPAAQRRFNPKGFRHHHGEGDRHQAVDLLSRLSGHPDVLGAHMGLVEAQARAFVENRGNWAAIEALAAALLDRLEIPGREIASIIRVGFQSAVEKHVKAVKP